jgi:hypothetical protein
VTLFNRLALITTLTIAFMLLPSPSSAQNAIDNIGTLLEPPEPKPRQSVQKVRYWNILPPVEYDKPYTGELSIIRLSSPEEIRVACKNSSEYACISTEGLPHRCTIFMLPDKQLSLNGISLLAFTLRHELGHCNGWPNHDGGRKIFLGTHVEMPKLPPSTRELPVFPPVVCVTPEWKQEPCASRAPRAIEEAKR